MKRLTMSLLIVTAMFSSCQKEGPKGETGASGPDAVMQSYTLYYESGETYKQYSGFVGSYDSGDIIVTYVDDPNEVGVEGFWVQTPFISNNEVNFYAETTNSGSIFLNTLVAGTGASPWTQQHYFNYRSVLIKGTGLAKNPNLDLTDYREVKEAFDL